MRQMNTDEKTEKEQKGERRLERKELTFRGLRRHLAHLSLSHPLSPCPLSVCHLSLLVYGGCRPLHTDLQPQTNPSFPPDAGPCVLGSASKPASVGYSAALIVRDVEHMVQPVPPLLTPRPPFSSP